YHFIRPKVGSGFVFRTGNIPDIARQAGDQYYIKRLIGVPGDTLEIREPVLYRNGQPITGSSAFDANARREGRYAGYFNIPAYAGGTHMKQPGETLAVPDGNYFA